MTEQIVLDLETKKGFNEVAGRDVSLLGVSVAVIYSYREAQFRTFWEQELEQLLPYLQQAELIIGFNIKKFDFPVLQPYLNIDFTPLNTLDIFEEVECHLGFRLGLNSLAQTTLKTGKSGTGLDALKYYRQGELEKLAQYCRQDVLVTRDLYEYGRTHGHLLFQRKGDIETIPVRWGEDKRMK